MTKIIFFELMGLPLNDLRHPILDIIPTPLNIFGYLKPGCVVSWDGLSHQLDLDQISQSALAEAVSHAAGATSLVTRRGLELNHSYI